VERDVAYAVRVSSEPAHTVRCLKARGRRSVWLIQRPGQACRTIKHWPITPGIALKLLLGIAQPQRQMRGQRRLTAANIASPAVRHWRIVVHDRWPTFELEMDYVDGESVWDLLRTSVADSPMQHAHRRRIALHIGKIVQQLIRARLFHRDLKLENIIVTSSDEALSVIDPVGVRPMRFRVVEAERMLERLAIQPASRGMSLPPGVVFLVVRVALAAMSGNDRREVLERLRLRELFDLPIAKATGGT
jgi:serine/threonine protein kinase